MNNNILLKEAINAYRTHLNFDNTVDKEVKNAKARAYRRNASPTYVNTFLNGWGERAKQLYSQNKKKEAKKFLKSIQKHGRIKVIS